jgi:hypothetical protein
MYRARIVRDKSPPSVTNSTLYSYFGLVRQTCMRIIALLAFATNLQLAALGGSLRLVVLGSGGPRPFGRAGSSYIVEINGVPRILVDVGPGTFLRVGELNIDLNQVDTVELNSGCASPVIRTEYALH